MTIAEYLTKSNMKLEELPNDNFKKDIATTIGAVYESAAVGELLALDILATPRIDQILLKLPKFFAMGFYYGKQFSEIEQLEKMCSLE